MTAAQIDTRKVEQGVDTTRLVERRHDEFVASYAVSTGWTSPRAAKPSRLRCAIWAV